MMRILANNANGTETNEKSDSRYLSSIRIIRDYSMKFHYLASQLNGKVLEGNEEAGSTAELLALLATRGLKPISIRQLKGDVTTSLSGKFFGGKITVADKMFLTKYLSIMLKVGIDLFQAVNILLADFQKSTLRGLLTEIRENLENILWSGRLSEW